MKKDENFECIFSYARLGYEITLTQLYGKDAIRMTRIYSHKAGGEVICEQIYEYEKLKDPENFRRVADFMYNDIQEQENTGKYYKRD